MIDPNEAPEGYIAERYVPVCVGCAFMNSDQCATARCMFDERKDRQDVIFKKKPLQGMTPQDIDESLGKGEE